MCLCAQSVPRVVEFYEEESVFLKRSRNLRAGAGDADAVESTGELAELDEQGNHPAVVQVQAVCQEVGRVFKAEEAQNKFELVKAKLEEGDKWFSWLNSARLEPSPPASSEAWEEVVRSWSVSLEARVAVVQEQVAKAEALAQEAASRFETAKRHRDAKQRARTEMETKARAQRETLKLTREESASNHQRAADRAKVQVNSGNINIPELKEVLAQGNTVWV